MTIYSDKVGQFPNLEQSYVIESFRSLSNSFKEGVYSQTITVLGDSTGYNTWMWVYKLGQLFAANYPKLRVEYELFDNSNVTPAFWDYAPIQIISAGNNGARSLRFTGIRGRNQVASLVGDFTNDADVSAQVSLDNWNSGSQSIVSRYDSISGGWNFYQSGGNLALELVTSGYVNKLSTVGHGITNGTIKWVRFTYVASSGLITFYTGNDGVNWTQLGAAVSATVTGTFVQVSTKDYEIGSKDGPTLGGPGIDFPLTGNIYNVRIRQGINGPIMNQQSIESWYYYNSGGVSFAGGQTLYIKNGSIPGATLTSLSNSTTLNKQLQDCQPNIIFISCSHNDLSSIDKTYFNAFTTYINSIKARNSLSTICILNQNPNASSAIFTEPHGLRSKRLITYAQSNNISSIDTYAEFTKSSYGIEALTGLPENADGLGVHPNALGGSLWANTVFNYF